MRERNVTVTKLNRIRQKKKTSAPKTNNQIQHSKVTKQISNKRKWSYSTTRGRVLTLDLFVRISEGEFKVEAEVKVG